jgi:hypothetical protein
MNVISASPNESPSHTFIVRLWCEQAQPGNGGEWRGSIEHALTQEKRYFRDINTLAAFIRRQVGWVEPASPASSLPEPGDPLRR